MKKIFKQSIDLFGEEKVQKEVKKVRVDTTVQENNIIFPTDRKLTGKIIYHCKRIARKESIALKQQLWFARKPKNMRNHIKAQKKLHGIAFKLFRDFKGQLNPIPMSYKEELDIL